METNLEKLQRKVLTMPEVNLSATILEVLMRRDHLSKKEALMQIKEAKKALQDYLAEGDLESAENVCEEFFGLEPDYVIDLM